MSFSHPREPLLDHDIADSDIEEEPQIAFDDHLNIQSLAKDHKTVSLVYKTLTQPKGSEPNHRELNDILFQVDLSNVSNLLTKKQVLSTIDEELYIHEQVDVRMQVERTVVNMQRDQRKL